MCYYTIGMYMHLSPTKWYTSSLKSSPEWANRTWCGRTRLLVGEQGCSSEKPKLTRDSSSERNGKPLRVSSTKVAWFLHMCFVFMLLLCKSSVFFVILLAQLFFYAYKCNNLTFPDPLTFLVYAKKKSNERLHATIEELPLTHMNKPVLSAAPKSHMPFLGRVAGFFFRKKNRQNSAGHAVRTKHLLIKLRGSCQLSYDEDPVSSAVDWLVENRNSLENVMSCWLSNIKKVDEQSMNDYKANKHLTGFSLLNCLRGLLRVLTTTAFKPRHGLIQFALAETIH